MIAATSRLTSAKAVALMEALLWSVPADGSRALELPSGFGVRDRPDVADEVLDLGRLERQRPDGHEARLVKVRATERDDGEHLLVGLRREIGAVGKVPGANPVARPQRVSQ